MDVSVDYIDYVEKQIALYKKLATLRGDEETTPEMVNTALATYQEILIALIGEYNRAKIFEYETNKRYSMWYDETFSEVRKDMILSLGNKAIKISVKEYETELRVRHIDEYWDWQDKITVAESKTAFILRLLESWKSYDKILVTLAGNMKSEMYSLSLDNRINLQNDKVRTLPVRPSRQRG